MHQPLAYIHSDANIARNVVIDPFVTIEKDVEIGEGTWIGSNVTIMEGARIGKDCRIFPGAVISAIPQDLKFKGEKSLTIIGDKCTIRECATINRGTSASGKTVVGNNCLIMAYSHVAHDCEIENDVVLTNQAALAGAVKVGEGAILGGYAIVHQYCEIGAYSFCAMGSAVNKDVPAFVRVRGNPARSYGINSIGLRRQGFTKSAIEALKSAYRSVYRKNLTVEEALKEISPLVKKHKEVKLFATTIKKSNRGIAR